MDVTLPGIVIVFKEEQPSNMEVPIDATPSPMMALVKLVQLRNASSPMDVTLPGTVIVFKETQPSNMEVPMDVVPWPIMARARLVQLRNAHAPADVMLPVIVALVSPEHWSKAYPPRVATLLGMMMPPRRVQ
jgi:hypothetical protein